MDFSGLVTPIVSLVLAFRKQIFERQRMVYIDCAVSSLPRNYSRLTVHIDNGDENFIFRRLKMKGGKMLERYLDEHGETYDFLNVDENKLVSSTMEIGISCPKNSRPIQVNIPFKLDEGATEIEIAIVENWFPMFKRKIRL